MASWSNDYQGYRYCSYAKNSMMGIHLGFITLIIMLEYTQARIGYFWHITDLHLDTIYSTQGDVMRSCWRIERQTSSSSTHAPGRYGDYLCDSPWSLIESAARAMKSRQGDNVEFVLWTGDGLSHSSHPMFESKKLEILRNITDLLGRTFSSQFVFPVLGHEDGTTTNFRHMGELWRHWLPSEALHTFEKGGYYSIEQTKSRLRIIALNTNFMRHDPKYSQSHLAAVRQRTPVNANGLSESKVQEYKNFYYHHGSGMQHQHHGHSNDWPSNHNYAYGSHHRGISVLPNGSIMDGGGRVSALSEFENQDTEKQWAWLEEVLYKSKLNKETVYIVGHIPPGSDERHIGLQQNGHTTFTESNNKRYLELVRKYSSIIQGQFFGHLHSDSFRIIYDDKGKPVSWMMISPSVTPRKMSVGSNNPAMRLYKFDTDSGQLLDYTQYYMDLQVANTLGEPNWLPEYNLTHYYGLTDISAISLHNFVDRFISGDASWFAKYYRANTVRYQTEPCEGVCMLNHYCAITRVDYKEFRQCLEKEQSALRSSASLLQRDDKHIYLLALMLMLIIMMKVLCNIIHLQHSFIKVQASGQARQDAQAGNKLYDIKSSSILKSSQVSNDCAIYSAIQAGPSISSEVRTIVSSERRVWHSGQQGHTCDNCFQRIIPNPCLGPCPSSHRKSNDRIFCEIQRNLNQTRLKSRVNKAFISSISFNHNYYHHHHHHYHHYHYHHHHYHYHNYHHHHNNISSKSLLWQKYSRQHLTLRLLPLSGPVPGPHVLLLLRPLLSSSLLIAYWPTHKPRNENNLIFTSLFIRCAAAIITLILSVSCWKCVATTAGHLKQTSWRYSSKGSQSHDSIPNTRRSIHFMN